MRPLIYGFMKSCIAFVCRSDQNTWAAAEDKIHRGTENELTFVNDFLLVAPGSGNNLRLHELVHITVDANGEITAEVNNITVDCG